MKSKGEPNKSKLKFISPSSNHLNQINQAQKESNAHSPNLIKTDLNPKFKLTIK